MLNEENNYEMVNHPTHYQMYEEVVEMIDKVAGHFIAAMWCKWNGFKYRMRMGTKPGNSVEQELGKEKVYLDLYKKYMFNLKNNIQKGYFNKLTKDEKDYISAIVSVCGEEINGYMKNTDKYETVTITATGKNILVD